LGLRELRERFRETEKESEEVAPLKVRNFTFFTDIGAHQVVKWNEHPRGLPDPKLKEVIWDAGVFVLKHRDEYDNLVGRAEWLFQEPWEFGWKVIPDYPDDLLRCGKILALRRTVARILEWRPRSGRYPCWCMPVLQYAPNGLLAEWWDKTIRAYGRTPRVLGIGGLCRHLGKKSGELVTYVNQVLNHWLLQPEARRPKRLHFFGLPMAGIRALAWCLPRLAREGLSVSVDSTKWTRPRTGRGKPSAKDKRSRVLLYEEYCQELKRIVESAFRHTLLETKD